MYVYLPSEEIVEEWKSLAKNARTSISKFVFEHVENSLKQEEENAKLKEENRILKTAYERLDDELKHYRTKPFLEDEYEGKRRYEKVLVDILKKRKTIGNYERIDLLRIDPKDSDLVRAVYRHETISPIIAIAAS